MEVDIGGMLVNVSTFLKNLSILKKFLFINFIIFYNYWIIYIYLFKKCSAKFNKKKIIKSY